MEVLRQASILALLTLTIDLVPLAMAVIYVVRPTERNLALMRPLSLAGLVAALSGSALGFMSVLRGIGGTPSFSPASYSAIATGASESLVPMFVGFGCLSVAWLLVALGLSRQRSEV